MDITIEVWRVEDEHGRGPFTDESTPERAYIAELLSLDGESKQFPPAQEDALPTGNGWSCAFASQHDAINRLATAGAVDLMNSAGYALVAYEVLDSDVIVGTSGTQVAFRKAAATIGERKPVALAAIDTGHVDPYETCCPHCGFCGQETDNHGPECGLCKGVRESLLTTDPHTTPDGQTPVYTHDDDEFCFFLGHFDGHDLYVHHHRSPTYVARASNDESDYISGAPLVGRDLHITEAHRLATERGIALDLNIDRADLIRSSGVTLDELAVLLGVKDAQ